MERHSLRVGGRFAPIERTPEEAARHRRKKIRERAARGYTESRKLLLEERLVKTRAKMQILIQEAKDFGMEHLLLEGE